MPRVRLTVGSGHVRAELRRGGVVLWAAEAAHAGPGDLTGVIAALAAEGGLGRARCVEVHLMPPVVQHRVLTDLPPVRSPALDALVRHQASRFFRRTASPPITRAMWVRGGLRGLRGPRWARAVAVEATWLAALVDGAEAAGLTLGRIVPVVDGVALERLRLVPPMEEYARRLALRTSVRRWGLAALVCWAAAVAVAVTRLQAERERLEAELATLAKPLAAVTRARHAIDQTRRMVTTVVTEQRRQGTMLHRLGAVAEALPDSAYLTSLEFDDQGRGVLTGVARRAAEVVAVLERHDGLVAPRLEGPAVRELAGGREWERFTLRLGRDSTHGGQR